MTAVEGYRRVPLRLSGGMIVSEQVCDQAEVQLTDRTRGVVPTSNVAMRRIPVFDFNNLRYAVRGLRKSPGFASTSILTLALGIGVTSGIFSVVYGVLLQSLPYRPASRLCLVWKSVPKKNLDRDWTSYPTVQDWNSDAASFEDVAVFLRPDGSVVNVTENEDVEQIQSAKVSANLFRVLGTPGLLGRTFMPADVAENANLAVMSYGFWKSHFNSDKNIVGKKLAIDGALFEVVGVMPPKFGFPARESQTWSPSKETQLWLPVNSDPRWTKFQTIRLADAFGVVARLRSNTSVEQAQAEMGVISRRLAREHPDTDKDLNANVVPLSLYLVGSRMRLTLWLFFGAVVIILLIACSNVAGLFLSRTFTRRKTLAVQVALGAERSHILRQLFAEAVVVSLVAGAVGLGLSELGVKAFTLSAPTEVPGLENVGLNADVAVFTLAVALVSGIVSVLVPAWKFSAVDPQDALRERPESIRHGRRMSRVLVFVECALAIVLLTSAGLLLRSAIRLQDVDLGFRPDHLVSMSIFLHGQKYDGDNQIRAFVDEAIRRVGALPGVRSTAVGTVFLGRVPNSQLLLEERSAESSVVNDVPTTWTYVSEGFFQTLGIPLLRGRNFTSMDGPESAPVVIVNQSMARRLWPGEDPIGKRFKYNVPGYVSKEWLTVVGVAGDIARNGPETRPISVIYYPVRQKVWDALTLMVRTDSDPTTVETTIGNEIHRIDKTIPRAEVSTVEGQLRAMGSSRRFQIELFSLFALLAVVLAAIGIYAVMTQAVGQRTREIGVRLALGAGRAEVLWMILRQGLGPVVLGLVVGVCGALALTRMLASLLYGITPTDPLTYLGVSVFLFAIATVAAYIPARRAMQVDPMVALRYE